MVTITKSQSLWYLLVLENSDLAKKTLEQASGL